MFGWVVLFAVLVPVSTLLGLATACGVQPSTSKSRRA